MWVELTEQRLHVSDDLCIVTIAEEGETSDYDSYHGGYLGNLGHRSSSDAITGCISEYFVRVVSCGAFDGVFGVNLFALIVKHLIAAHNEQRLI